MIKRKKKHDHILKRNAIKSNKCIVLPFLNFINHTLSNNITNPQNRILSTFQDLSILETGLNALSTLVISFETFWRFLEFVCRTSQVSTNVSSVTSVTSVTCVANATTVTSITFLNSLFLFWYNIPNAVAWSFCSTMTWNYCNEKGTQSYKTFRNHKLVRLWHVFLSQSR